MAGARHHEQSSDFDLIDFDGVVRNLNLPQASLYLTPILSGERLVSYVGNQVQVIDARSLRMLWEFSTSDDFSFSSETGDLSWKFRTSEIRSKFGLFDCSSYTRASLLPFR